MDYGSASQYINALKNKVRKAVLITAEEGKGELKQSIETVVYQAYTPSVYDRTYKLLDSVSVDKLKEGGGMIYTSIFLDSNILAGHNPDILTGRDVSQEIPQRVIEGIPYLGYGRTGYTLPRDFVSDFNRKFDVSQQLRENLKQMGVNLI